MTSRIDSLKTDEFLRRRKLRLQQVREQSKDIAKKIRQRATVEKLRHLDDIDAKKQKEYLDCQEKLVKHLELLHRKGLKNIGTSHKNALEVSQQEDALQSLQKIDLTKLRGREAVAELRKKKQEKLNEQKKLLDRKLQAREAANEISREKSTTVVKNLKPSPEQCEVLNSNLINTSATHNQKERNLDLKEDNIDKGKNDMGTQWESAELLNEWEPSVPELLLPKDDTVKDSVNENVEKIDKIKKLNLFALSDEMPTSLRGGLTDVTYEEALPKSSLTQVSEYLQNRSLRLRQNEPISKKVDDLQSIKQTILRNRATRIDGNVFDNVCRVLDEQLIPVPSWQAQGNSGLCSHLRQHNCYSNRVNKTLLRVPVNNLLFPPKSLQRQSSPVLKEVNQIWRTKFLCGTCKQTVSKDKSSHSTELNTGLTRKKSISVYNHNTRNTQNMPCSDERLVYRDNKAEEDAYAQALKATNIQNTLDNERSNKEQNDMRTKVAVTKQNVDKEYRDTLAFLNTLTRDKNEKPEKLIKTAYMDEHQQQMQNERHQRKLQQEFKKIEKDCYKRTCKHSKRKPTIFENNRSKTISPVQTQATGKEFEYSWMPVPDGDSSLAVHTIPNTKHKSGNNVKFSIHDSYHEYRSRHKHTPPTKDKCDNRQTKRYREAVLVHQTTDDSDDNRSSLTSETSSAENISLTKYNTKTKEDSLLKDADRIIIYKVLESKKGKGNKDHKMTKRNKGTMSNDTVTNERKNEVNEGDESKTQEPKKSLKLTDVTKRGVSFEQLQEGVYEAVTDKRDNVTSLYFTEDPKGGDEENQREKFNKTESCCKDKDLQIDGGDNSRTLKQASSYKCGSKCRKDDNIDIAQPSAATSSMSFTTAFNDKINNRLNEDGFLHLIDRTQESSKFYVGASGFLKDENYEVVIQLRKKEVERDNVCTKQPSSPIKSLETESQELVKDVPSNDLSATKGNEASPPMKNPSSVEVDSTHKKLQTPNNQQTLIEIKSVEGKQNSPLNDMCEKDTHTSFQDSYAIPVHIPKLDPISRQATSTYTQTSFNSSIPRPPFMHMSSSTSTAYMSPPELILPKFLKQNYVMTNDEISESENTMSQMDSNFIAINDENCKEFSECMCSACMRYRSKTPPNTARNCNKDKSAVEYVRTKKTKCKCHKCRSRSETNIHHKIHTKKCRSMLTTRSSKDLSSDKRNPTTKKLIQNKNENTCPYRTSGNKLNPTVKNYVNRLLALNREGLKAVEIINQDCSGITTPGSSIINLSCNVNKDKSNVQNKISLEQVKNVLKQKIVNEDLIGKQTNVENKESQTDKYQKLLLKLPKKKSVHKVKSLNISKIFKKKKPYNSCMPTQSWNKTSKSAREDNKSANNIRKQVQTSRSKNFTTPRIHNNSQSKNSASSDYADVTDTEPHNASGKNTKRIINDLVKSPIHTKPQRNKNFNIPLHKATRTSFSSDSDVTGTLLRNLRTHTLPPIHISTQTNDIIDAEIKFMKIAEDKLQNMEKIADLTEKCTKRLSNLAKVLEEVRRNKSLVYSQISTSDSTPESESKADKNDGSIEILNERMSDLNILTQNKEISLKLTTLIMPEKLDDKYVEPKGSAEFTTFLRDIPKPVILKTPLSAPFNLIDCDNKSTNMLNGTENIKSKGKPPPALSRIHFKHGQDIYVVPHELSTVIEVESPMSTKLKSQTSRQDSKLDIIEKSDHNAAEKHNELTLGQENPDLLKTKTLSRRLSKVSSTDSSDDSKMRMMDLKKFNDIMLKPFITLQEYAKQCNIGLEEGTSNFEDANKEEPINDDLSSLHSDGSLPDVIAELLKRKIISEPFKFDTGSNVNSTTFSSESTLSVLALSKERKEKKKSSLFVKNKENIGDSSESLSISSNPDLENAFQKLGMGWASSTLKKTKERLALSSSSNTSSSSMTQFKIKNFNPDIPNLGSDSASTSLDAQNKCDRKERKREEKRENRYIEETSRNAVQQQTSLTNSMTVKEFLTNELSKRITFNNKSIRREADEEFISLYETKMPEVMKHTSKEGAEDPSSVTSANNNRARTSTPVQIFKSQAYHSSSTSNTSNGFFSNADDLSSVKVTSTSIRNHSTSDKDDLTIPNYSLKTKKSDCSKSD